MRIVHRGRLFVLCGVVSTLLSAVPAMAAVNAYMTVTGEKQGPIRSVGMSDNIPLVSVVRDAPMRRGCPPANGCTPPSPSPKGRRGVAQVCHGAGFK